MYGYNLDTSKSTFDILQQGYKQYCDERKAQEAAPKKKLKAAPAMTRELASLQQEKSAATLGSRRRGENKGLGQ